MAAETAIMFSLVTGRTLVMPPTAVWYLLNRNRQFDENKSNFDKFFDLRKIQEAMPIISMEEFLTEIAAKGLLKKPFPPPTSPTKNIKEIATNRPILWKYLEEACYCRAWEPGKMFIGFNLSHSRVELINGTRTVIPVFGTFEMNDRERRMAAHGRKLVPYDESLHNETAIYFPGDYRDTHRLLTHFYTYLYWEDPHLEHIYKRIVRDRLHYQDDIFCAAGRVVQQLHLLEQKATGKSLPSKWHPLTLGGNTNNDATYLAVHIRRGDFQYEHTRISAERIWGNIRPYLNRSRSSILYIATDEKNKSFFTPFKELFTLKFIDDFMVSAHLEKENQNHIGMIEQVICANAHTFIGTPLSTFTGYITRMRGYYRDGRYSRTYYTMRDAALQLHQQPELVGPFWAREFAVAHRDIDDDPNP